MDYTHILETTTRWAEDGSLTRLRSRLVELEDLEGIVELIADGSEFILVEGNHFEYNEKYGYYMDTRTNERARGEFTSYDKNLGLIRRAGNTFEALPVGPGRGIIFIGELVNDLFFLTHVHETSRAAYFEHARGKMNEFKFGRDMNFDHMCA